MSDFFKGEQVANSNGTLPGNASPLMRDGFNNAEQQRQQQEQQRQQQEQAAHKPFGS